MKKPDALDLPRLTNGHGADKTFCRPFVKLCPRAAGIKFVPVLGARIQTGKWPSRSAASCGRGTARVGLPFKKSFFSPFAESFSDSFGSNFPRTRESAVYHKHGLSHTGPHAVVAVANLRLEYQRSLSE